MFFSIIFVLVLLSIAWYDFKYRLIPIWLFMAFLGVVFANCCFQLSFSDCIFFFVVNSLVVAVLLLGVWVWFVLVKQSSTNILDSSMGKGDLLFMLITGFYFSPFFFIVFQVFSVSVLLIVFGFYILLSQQKRYPIPMAGAQAMLLVVFELLKINFPVGIQFRDQLFIHYIFSALC